MTEPIIATDFSIEYKDHSDKVKPTGAHAFLGAAYGAGRRTGKTNISGTFQVKLITNQYAMQYHFGDDKSPELCYLANNYRPGDLLPRGKCRRRYGKEK